MDNNESHVTRHEHKYYLSVSDYIYAKSMLKHLMQQDKHQSDPNGYFIRSLYFDDLNDTSVNEKLAGVEFRDKYRLRIYDTNQNWAKLERKRKHNNYVKKTSVIMTRGDAEKLVAGDIDVLLNYKTANARSIYFDFKKKFLKPVAVIDYTRDAYMLDYNDIRITFDKGLRANDRDFKLYDKKMVSDPLQREDVVIMEVKFNNCLPSWFRDLFRFESATVSAISKYCQSRLHTHAYYYA